MTNLHSLVPQLPYWEIPLLTSNRVRTNDSSELDGYIEAVWMESFRDPPSTRPLERPMGLFRPFDSMTDLYVVWIDDMHGSMAAEIVRGRTTERRWTAVSGSCVRERGNLTSAVYPAPRLLHPVHGITS